MADDSEGSHDGELPERIGLDSWFTKSVQGMVGGVNWSVAFLVLCLFYFYSHCGRYPASLGGLGAWIPEQFFQRLTHYGSGPASVIFGSGYVELGTWWKLGARSV
jgi:divalent anion:Na+ symporter, DASS family